MGGQTRQASCKDEQDHQGEKDPGGGRFEFADLVVNCPHVLLPVAGTVFHLPSSAWTAFFASVMPMASSAFSPAALKASRSISVSASLPFFCRSAFFSSALSASFL